MTIADIIILFISIALLALIISASTVGIAYFAAKLGILIFDWINDRWR